MRQFVGEDTLELLLVHDPPCFCDMSIHATSPVSGYAIVIEQRVVNIKEEDDFV